MKRTLSVLVENRPGVLTHISGLISRRGYNIESIAASSTELPDVTRISLVVEVVSTAQLEQIVAQLEKLVQVIKVIDMTNNESLVRELALLKIKVEPALRQEIINLTEIFRARILDVHPETMVIEITGDGEKVTAFCKLMEKYGIIEIIRTGEIFLTRDAEPAVKIRKESLR
ncbi:MAG: acetolactate synthase small subunit [Clostridia bacterium]|jgi:acetolactate synthase-1/3 small subunit|nr:acetolactate synthase small subunit [Clostridia bacterium]MDD4571083.1 acetolactate synthase small subunit [Clostridia bacterium]